MITNIHISNFWDKYQISFQPYPDVNIFLGENGSGKTTLLDKIEGDLVMGKSLRYDIGLSNITTTSMVYKLVRTFDEFISRKEAVAGVNTPLDMDLDSLIRGNNDENGFYQYRFKEMDKTELLSHKVLFSTINSFFNSSNKIITFDKNYNIVFQHNDAPEFFPLNKLSSGEKQLLILLFTVFLQEGNPFILLLDEPEISLHATWQRKLVAAILSLNPQCQLFITTHSGSIIAEGWGDRIWRMENLLKSK